MKWMCAKAAFGLVSVVLAGSAVADQHVARNLRCEAAPQIAARLATLAQQWQARLRQEPGYAPVPQIVVCLARSGLPFADQKHMRIYVRPLDQADAQTTLAHEYLHLAFARYPSGRDEAYIERLAQELVEQP